ncbi:putative ammonium transporter 1 [Amphiura filiformis]|uniref:putative ammonium transporter 1 n=1 Tax=Amphiura filiformis TaxID=82378 RepID=UPI003B216ABD
MPTPSLEEQVKALQDNSDAWFLIVVSLFIMFMQCGFAFLEAGSVRSKNTTNILTKNLLDVCLAGITYWAFGYAFAFGEPGNAFIGTRFFFFESMPASKYQHWFFHLVFTATAATIVSGSMAERTEFAAYLFYTVGLSGFIYPVVAHWAWDSSGWLYAGPNGVAFQDFAGSGVVHMVGGTAAFIGAAVLGPRIGRFQIDGTANLIEGHTVPQVALGGFILFLGFNAFNGGSQASISGIGDGIAVTTAVVNTILSGSGGALIAMVIKRLGFQGHHWSLLTAINGGLTGMVAICAGCNAVSPWGAVIIGSVAGVVYIISSWAVIRIKVDDPLDAVAVHLGGGLWGVIAAPFFSYQTGILTNWNNASGVQLGWNLVGAVAIFAWTGVLCLIMFSLLQYFGMLRVSKELELKGLDIPKHGEPAYPVSAYGHGWMESIVNQGTGKGQPNGSGHTNQGFSNDGVLPVQVFHVSHTDKGHAGNVKEKSTKYKKASDQPEVSPIPEKDEKDEKDEAV